MKHGMLSLILIVATNLRAQQPPIVSFFPFLDLTIGISPSSLEELRKKVEKLKNNTKKA